MHVVENVLLIALDVCPHRVFPKIRVAIRAKRSTSIGHLIIRAKTIHLTATVKVQQVTVLLLENGILVHITETLLFTVRLRQF